MNFSELRSRYKSFKYKDFSYSFENGSLVLGFNYSIDEKINFSHRVVFHSISNLKEIDEDQIKAFVFHIGMFESLSYYKMACNQEFLVECGCLTNDQKDFYKNLFINGLGEFFYENEIDFTENNFIEFNSVSSDIYKFHGVETKLNDREIVPVGGGKDSGSVLGIFSKENLNYMPLIMTPHSQFESSKNLIFEAGSDDYIYIERKLDFGKIMQLREDGFLNGHIPITAILSILSCFAGLLFDYKNIVLANSSSSNESYAKYLGHEISHQWSKSYDFEKIFINFLNENLSKELNYFSITRPILEVQTIGVITKFPEMLNNFYSCNKSRKNGWCGKCAKCLYVCLAMFVFLDIDKVESIFGNEILNDKNLEKYYREMVGLEKTKPFDCIGTISECRYSSYKAYEKYKNQGKELPHILNIFEKDLLSSEDWEFLEDQVLNHYDLENFLNPNFERILKKYLD